MPKIPKTTNTKMKATTPGVLFLTACSGLLEDDRLSLVDVELIFRQL